MNGSTSLAGQVAIVTGASKGIGAAIARGLAEAGAAVVVNYASAREGAERVVKDIVDGGGRALAVQADVSRPADVARLFAEARAAFDRLDILVNNAAVYTFGPLESVTVEEFHRQFDTNVLGVMLTIGEAVKAFGQKGGSIINIGSTASRITDAGSLIYTATKSAVDGITGVMARELASRNIRVNSINPGPTETEGARTLGVIGSDLERQFVARTPLGRMGQPTDIAPIAVFLASPEAGWLTGETLLASGGLR